MARRVSIPDAGDAVTVEGRSSPKLREARKSDISAEQIETFFITLGDTCNVVRSARAAGFSANWAYRRRKYDAAFRNGWVAAVREGYAKLEVVLLERAMKGPIWRRARCRRNCSTMRRCSDTLLCPAVEGPASVTPPASPAVGSCFLVAPGATDGWAGQDGALACFSEGGWRFVPPVEGTSLVDRSSGEQILYRGGAWQVGIVHAQEVRIDGQAVLGIRQAAIGDPSGGTVVDSQCRTAVSEILGALRAHGLIG